MALAYTVTGKLWIGLLAGDRPDEAFMLGIQMSAVMVLMPQIVKCIMEGLLPLSERAKKILSKRFGNGEFYIGLDPAVLLGDSQVVTAGLLFIPITLLISMILPGNQVLPFGDLATISFFIAIAVAVHKGNLFRTLISGSLIMTMTLWITNQTIPWVTALAKDEIPHQFGHVKGETRSCINILDEGYGSTEYLEPGFEVAPEEEQDFMKKFPEIIRDSDVVTISGSIPRGLKKDIYGRMITIAKAMGKTVLLDSSGDTLKNGITAGPNLVKPNQDEIEQLFDTKITFLKEVIAYAKKIHEMGVDNVVLSLGKRRSWL